MRGFNDLALKYASDLGQVLTHFDLCPIDESSRIKAYRYVKRNQQRLWTSINEGSIKGASFYVVGEQGDFFEAPMSLTVMDWRRNGRYGVVIFHCMLDLLDTKAGADLLWLDLINRVTEIVDVQYAISDTIEARKYPVSYFLDSACSVYLTKDEENDINTWRNQGSLFREIVRGVYWGNLLTSGHWDGDDTRRECILSGLKRECGEKVSLTDKGGLIFRCPFNIRECEDLREEILGWKRRVKEILIDAGVKVLND